MLILTRRQNQSIKLGSEITLRILAIKGGQVRVGIDAPKDVAIYREELARRIGQEHAQKVP
jgi:carbon storage regulator